MTNLSGVLLCIKGFFLKKQNVFLKYHNCSNSFFFIMLFLQNISIL